MKTCKPRRKPSADRGKLPVVELGGQVEIRLPGGGRWAAFAKEMTAVPIPRFPSDVRSGPEIEVRFIATGAPL